LEKIIFDTFGYIAIILHIISLISFKNKKILKYGMFSLFFLFISYIYYNAYMGSILSIISFISKFLNLYTSNKIYKIYEFYYKKLIFLLLPLLILILYPKEGIIVIFPILGLLSILHADKENDIYKIKIYYMISALLWIVYGVYINSIPSILYDVSSIFVLIISIYFIKCKVNENSYSEKNIFKNLFFKNK